MLRCQQDTVMQSHLIISLNKKTAEEQAFKICRDFFINRFDITVIDKTSQSIGIADIRGFQNKIFLKPLKSKIKAVILKNSENLTIEAQNALLKILEEPPPNTIIILIAKSKDSLLSTIQSRCKIIDIKEQMTGSLEKESAQYLNILISLNSLRIGERLKTAQDNSKTKEDALVFLEKMILTARQKIIDCVNNNQSKTLPEKQELVTLDNLKDILTSLNNICIILKTTNANPRLALENFLLNF